MAWVSFHGAAWPTLASVAISPARTHALRDSVRAVRGCCARNRQVAAHPDSSGLFKGGPYGWGEQRHQSRDVVEGLDVEHSLFDRALAVCGDNGASEAPVLVDDIGVGEHSIARAARVIECSPTPISSTRTGASLAPLSPQTARARSKRLCSTSRPSTTSLD